MRSSAGGNYVLAAVNNTETNTAKVYRSSDGGLTFTESVFYPVNDIEIVHDLWLSDEGLVSTVAFKAKTGGQGYLYNSRDYGLAYRRHQSVTLNGFVGQLAWAFPPDLPFQYQVWHVQEASLEIPLTVQADIKNKLKIAPTGATPNQSLKIQSDFKGLDTVSPPYPQYPDAVFDVPGYHTLVIPPNCTRIVIRGTGGGGGGGGGGCGGKGRHELDFTVTST